MENINVHECINCLDCVKQPSCQDYTLLEAFAASACAAMYKQACSRKVTTTISVKVNAQAFVSASGMPGTDNLLGNRPPLPASQQQRVKELQVCAFSSMFSTICVKAHEGT